MAINRPLGMDLLGQGLFDRIGRRDQGGEEVGDEGEPWREASPLQFLAFEGARILDQVSSSGAACRLHDEEGPEEARWKLIDLDLIGGAVFVVGQFFDYRDFLHEDIGYGPI